MNIWSQQTVNATIVTVDLCAVEQFTYNIITLTLKGQFVYGPEAICHLASGNLIEVISTPIADTDLT